MTRIVSMTMPQSRRRAASIYGVEKQFSPDQHRILEHLMLCQPRPVLPEEMIALLWPFPDDEPEWSLGVVKVHITRLRRAGVPILYSQRAFGYRLPQDDDEVLVEAAE